MSREGRGRMQGAWWWSEEAKGKVKAKQEKFKALMESRTKEEVKFNKVQYRNAKKEAKKAMAIAKNNAYERLYQRLNAKCSSVRCIKDEDGRVLLEDVKVQDRWQSYFCKLFNGEDLDVSQHTEHLAREEQQNYKPDRPIHQRGG